MIKAAIQHHGAALIDCISPCVAFNNHEGSTKSFDYVREHNDAVNHLDVITGREELTADYAPGAVEEIVQHNGAQIRLRKMAQDYDPHDRIATMKYLQERQAAGEVVTGVLYVEPEPTDLHDYLNVVDQAAEPAERQELCPGAEALEQLNESLR
jgi:2-oxoglutarate ferredoxin oxidoreductase subunit beta